MFTIDVRHKQKVVPGLCILLKKKKKIKYFTLTPCDGFDLPNDSTLNCNQVQKPTTPPNSKQQLKMTAVKENVYLLIGRACVPQFL